MDTLGKSPVPRGTEGEGAVPHAHLVTGSAEERETARQQGRASTPHCVSPCEVRRP